VLEEPELVTLLPEEEEEALESKKDWEVVKDFAIDVAVLVGLKVAMILWTRRVVKSAVKMNKIRIPRQRNYS
jgi:hypothetical protein